jgi:hypothetical protein
MVMTSIYCHKKSYFQPNCCISLNWWPIPSSSRRTLSLYAPICNWVFCSVDCTFMSMILDAFVPSVGNGGQVGRFIGRCSGTFLVTCSGITTLVEWSSSSIGVYMYPFLTKDGMPPPIQVQHIWSGSVPSYTCIEQHSSLVYQILEILAWQSLNNKGNYIAGEGMMHSWSLALMPSVSSPLLTFLFAQTSLLVTAASCWNLVKLHWHASVLSG